MNTVTPTQAIACRLARGTVWTVVALLLCPAPPAWGADAGGEELERDLIRKLREHLDAKGRDDPLARAGDRMRQVQQRLAKQDCGKEVRDIQKHIVKDLEEAIKRMQQQRRPSGKGQPQKKKKALNKVRVPQPKPAGARKKPTGGGRKPAKQAGKGSSQAQDRRPPRHVRAEDWGFLPDVLREEILQRFKEGYLQQYRELLEQYYIRLSEKGKAQATE